MKKLLLMVAMITTVVMSFATIRPVNEAFPVKQSDGTTVMLYKHGNGFHAFYTTLDAQVVVRNSEGTLCYAQYDGENLAATAVVCHDIDERTADEQTFVASNTLRAADITMQQPQSVDGLSRVSSSTNGDGLGTYGVSAGGSVSSVGSLTIPVIMAQFSDVSFQDSMTIEKLTRQFNTEGYHEDSSLQPGSVKDYFVDNSNGLFTPSFDVVAKVTLSNSYSYYGANSSSGSDANAYAMVKEAISLAVAEGVDFSKYYVDSYVPNIIVYYAGFGEATGGDENTIWPHECDMTGPYCIMSNYSFKSYFVGNELYGTSSYNRMMGMGVFVHEFGHAMGLPDLYDTVGNYENDYPWGYWSVMDLGCYSGSSYAPIGYSAYERSFLGWRDIRELTEAEAVTLGDPNDADSESAVLFRNPSENNEYFILENRQPGTWYSTPAGLMVSRIAFSKSAWTGNTLNTNQSKKRSYVVTADGSTLSSSTLSSAALYGNGTNNKTEHDLYNGTTLSDCPVYKIIPQPDGTVTFNYLDQSLVGTTAASNSEFFELVESEGNLVSGDTVIIVCEDEAVAMTATIHDSNNKAAVSVSVSEGQAYGNDGVMKLALLQSSSGWGFYYAEGKVYLGASNSGIKTSSKAGSTNVATISISDGDATIQFGGSATCSYMGYSSDDVWFSCFAEPTGAVQIYRKVTSTGISAVKATSNTTADNAVYDLSGKLVGTSLIGLPKGVYMTNGKKYMVR